MTNLNFSQWLLRELENRKWSQVELSRRSGVSQAQITRVLSGERGIGEKALTAIAHALKLPPEQVFRAAGFLPKETGTDEWIDQMNHKIKLLPSSNRQIAEKILDALITQSPP